MEILQFLLNFFLEEYGDKSFAPIFESLKNNSFDIASTLKNLNPETLTPILKTFMNFGKNKAPNTNLGAQGLNPIINFADEKIVRSLNKYFSA